jgi:hypothetical protein
VTSWRDTASATAQGDLDGLLDAVLPFAEQQLERHGEFFPYGSTVSVEGQIAFVAADPGVGELPESHVLLDALYEAARSSADDVRAVAFVADVRLAGGSDAVRVQLEHKDGPVLVVLLPYSQAGAGLGDTITFGPMSVSTGHGVVWPD